MKNQYTVKINLSEEMLRKLLYGRLFQFMSSADWPVGLRKYAHHFGVRHFDQRPKRWKGKFGRAHKHDPHAFSSCLSVTSSIILSIYSMPSR